VSGKNTRLLTEMDARIKGIENLAGELKDLGKGIPVIEKNARCILSFVFALKFGISDVVDLETGGDNQWEKQ
jgi:hypothetical protein